MHESSYCICTANEIFMTNKQILIKNIIKQLEELLELETPTIEID